MNDLIDSIKLPILLQVKLENFSLYNLTPNITVNFAKGVYCLAGANGLGKSTFLAALNYGLTGSVPDPSRKFKSVDEYNKKNHFSNEYFSGRINENDRDSATINVINLRKISKYA